MPAPLGATAVQGMDADKYNGFNVLTSDFKQMLHYSNYEGKVNEVLSGTHGLSNALLDTSWPKVDRIKRSFDEVIQTKFELEDLLPVLQNDQTYPDEELPDTGVGKDWKRRFLLFVYERLSTERRSLPL